MKTRNLFIYLGYVKQCNYENVQEEYKWKD